ncbi:filamentous hemagglutinin N-terminal domain-containing protein [Silvimonas soli]|uniref:filamentous hemagglutinin N-terminal domain-containing protein n=1 Tax=Silvimonas soli TaxID=2980100 RepID=UPI0024B34687|nr:filamentous hemagglutinin N-terminal domain-containing protein [Silvimonas soli]
MRNDNRALQYRLATSVPAGAKWRFVDPAIVHLLAPKATPLRWWQRALVYALILTVAFAPIKVSFDQASGFSMGWNSAEAAPIVDPLAPIRFQPGITQTTGTDTPVPVVNITAPNANGISLNQYQQFNVDPVGLILNNSLVNGGSMLGGNVTANPNFNGRSASLIINQVSNSAFATRLNGSLEVFGDHADVVIANPNGVTCDGCSFINTPHLTLTTGSPVFLDSNGNRTSNFDQAAATGFDVRSGRVDVTGLGLEGSLDRIDLIAESVGMASAVQSNGQLNIISGQQLVLPVASGTGTAGSDFAVQSNGLANTAGAVTSTSTGFAIDASVFGAMTAGQIKIIATTQGLGVRTDGDLAASGGDLTISSNGDVHVGQAYSTQQLTINAVGTQTVSGDLLGLQGVSLNANGDVTTARTVESGGDLHVAAGGVLTTNDALTALGNVTLTSGSDMTHAAAVQAGGNLSATAGGNLTFNTGATANQAMNLSSVGALNATNLTAVAALTASSGGDLTLTGQNKIGGTSTLTSTAGSVYLQGTTATNDAITVTANRAIDISGTVNTTGATSLQTTIGNVTVDGQLGANQAVSVTAGQDILVSGQVGAGTNATLTANRDLTVSGTLLAQADMLGQATTGKVDIHGNAIAGGNLGLSSLQSTVNVDGEAAAYGKSAVTAATDITGSGVLIGNQGLSVNAQTGSVTVAGAETGGDLNLTAAQNINSQVLLAYGNATVQSGKDTNVSSATLTGGTMSINAQGALTLAGQTSAGQTATLTSGGPLTTSGSVVFQSDATLQSSSTILHQDGLQVGGNLLQTSTGVQGLDGTTYVLGNATLNSGNALLINNLLVQGDIATTSQADTTTYGQIVGLGNTSITATAGSITLNSNLSSAKTASLNAGTDISFNAAAQSGGDLGLNAGGNISITNALGVNGSLNAKAGQNLVSTGQISTGADTNLQAVQGSIGLGGTLQANGQLSGSAGNNVVVSGQVGGNQAVTLNAGNVLAVTGSLAAVGDLTATGGQLVAIEGTSAAGGKQSLIATQGSVNVDGTASATTGLNVAATQSLAGQGALVSQQDLTITAASSNFAGASQAAGNLNATTTGDMSLGSLAVGGNASLNAGGNTTLTGPTQVAGALGLTSSGDAVIGGPLAVGQSAQLTAASLQMLQGGVFNQNVQINTQGQWGSAGDVLVLGGNLAATTGSTQLNGNLVVLGNTGLGAVGDINLANGLTSSGTTQINSSNGNVLAGGAIQSQQALTITSSGNLTLNGGFAAGDTASLTSGGDLVTQGTVTTVSDAKFIATGQLNQSGNLQIGGTLQATSGGPLTLSGSTYAANGIALQSGSTLLANSLQTPGALTVTSTGDQTLGGTSIIVGDVALTSQQGSVNALGNLTGNGKLTVNALQDISLQSNSQTNLAGDTTLTTGRGDIRVDGQLAVGGATQLTAAGNASIGGAVVGNTNVTVNAGKTVTVAGALLAQNDLVVGAGDSLALTGSAGANGNLDLHAANTLSNTGSLSSGAQTTLTSGGDLTLGGTTLSGAALQITSSNGAVNVQGNAGANTDLSITAATNLTTSGTLISNNQMQLLAQAGNATLGGSIQSGSNIGVTTAGNLLVNGALASNTEVILQAGQNLAVGSTGSIAAVNDVSLHGTGNVSVDGSVNAGRNVDLLSTAQTTSVNGTVIANNLLGISGQSLAGTGTITAGSNLTLTTPGSTTFTGTANAGGDFNAAAGQNLGLGAVNTIGNATLNAGNGLTLAGPAQIGGALNATAGGDFSASNVIVAQTASFQSANMNFGQGVVTQQDLIINAAQAWTGNGDVIVGGKLLAQAGSVNLGGNIGVMGDTTIQSAGDLAVAKTIAVSGQTQLASTNGKLGIGGDLQYQQTATLTSASDMSVGGAISGPGALTATSLGGLQIGGTVNTGADVLLDAAKNLTLGGDANILGQAQLYARQGNVSAAGLAATNVQLQAGGNAAISGELDSTSDIAITATSGNLQTAAINATGKLAETTGGSITHAGDVLIQGVLQAQAGQNFTAQGQLYTGSDASISAGNNLALGTATGVVGNTLLKASAGDLTTAGLLSTGGTLNASAGGNLILGGDTQVVQNGDTTGTVTLTAGKQVGSNGNLAVAGNLNATGASAAFNGSITANNNVAITTTQGNLINNAAVGGNNVTLISAGGISGSGTLASAGTTSLNAVADINNTGTVQSAGQFTANGANVALGQIATTSGAIQITGSGSVALNGTIGGAQNVTIHAGNNASINGDIGSVYGALAISADHGTLSTTGTVYGGTGVTLNSAGQATLAQGVFAVGDATLNVGGLQNKGAINTSGNLTVTSPGTVDAGDVIAGNNVSLTGSNITTHYLSVTGDLYASATSNLTLANDSLTGLSANGQLVKGNATLNAGGTISNSNLLAVAKTLTTASGSLTNQSGASMLSGGDLDITTGSLTNAGMLSGANLNVTAGTLNNNGGSFYTAGNVTLNVEALTGNNNGSIGAQSGLTLTVADQSAALARIGATGVSLPTTRFNNQGGSIGALGNVTLNLQGQNLDTASGQVGNIGNSVDSGGNQPGSLTIYAGNFTRDSNWLAGSNTVTLNVGSFNNSWGTASNSASVAQNLTVNASGSLNNNAYLAATNLSLNGTSLTNSGTLHADNTLTTNTNGGTLNNNSGTLEAVQNVQLNGVGNLANENGKIQAANNVTINAAGTVDNSNNGSIIASCYNATGPCTGSVTLNEGALNNQNGGTVSATGNLNINGGSVDNSFGHIQSSGDMGIAIGGYGLTNTAGTITSAGAMTITASSILNQASGTSTSTTTTTTSDFSNPYVQKVLNETVVGTYISSYTSKPTCNNGCNFETGHFNTSNETIGSAAQYGSGVAGYSVADQIVSDSSDNSTEMQQLAPSGNTYRFALPSVDVTTVTQTAGTQGVISSGGNMTLNSNVTNIDSKIVSGSNLTINGNLNNANTAPVNTTVTYSVDQTALNNFVNAYNAQSNTLSNQSSADIWGSSTFSAAHPGSDTYTSTSAGFGGIVGAQGNMYVNGSFQNSATVTVGNNLTVTGANFTNEGYYQQTLTTTKGCVAGAKTCKGEVDARVQSFSYTESRANVTVGGDIQITADTVDNTHANLIALGNLGITSTGTLTNTSGTIASIGGDVTIKAGKIINQVQAPVSTHVSYGNTDPIGGCNPGASTYKGSNCSADILNAAGDPSLIQAGHDLSLTGSSLSNIGSAITAGNNAQLNISGDVLNQTVMLTEQWRGQWVQETSWFSKDKTHQTYGTIVQGTQDALIQAGNTLSGTVQNIQNTGAISADTIKINAQNLLNGLTDNHTPTPATTLAPQVISLAAGGTPVVTGNTKPSAAKATITEPMSSGMAAAVVMGVAGAASTPTATSGVDVTYLKHNSGDDVLGGISAAVLVNNLPADLRPDSSVAFYADPVIEQQLLTQAALQQTGQAYFVNGLSADDQTKASVADQQKTILYKDAIAWAEANDVQLGTALTQDQIAGLTAPMLWYVEEAVPDPACAGLPNCGTVNVLMPQVYLPANDQLAKQEGGSITGNNVTLNLSGSLTNTGTIAASNDLNITASSITNEARSVDIGQSAYKEASGWLQVSGTQVQPGGFISGANVSLNTDAINSIGGTFQVTDPATGQVDAAKSAQLIQDLGAKLGINYTQTSVSDNINQSFIKDTSGPGPVVVMIAAIVIAVLTYGAASELVAAAAAAETGTTAVGLAATGSTFAAATATTTAGLANAAIAAGAAGMASTATSELLTTGKLDGDSILKAGLVGALTAGITGELGIGSVTGGGLNNLGTNLVNAGERSLISAGLDTAVYGTSFGTAFEQSLAANAGASLNGAIGDQFGSPPAGSVNWLADVGEHAVLGCAMGALSGGGCSSGAMGGATSSIIAQPLIDTLPGNNGPNGRLLTDSADMAIAGVVASVTGHDAATAMNQAQSEVQNNTDAHQAAINIQKVLDLHLNGQVVMLTDQNGNKTTATGYLLADPDGLGGNWQLSSNGAPASSNSSVVVNSGTTPTTAPAYSFGSSIHLDGDNSSTIQDPGTAFQQSVQQAQSNSSFGTRVLGTLQAVGGAAQVGAAGLAAAACPETGGLGCAAAAYLGMSGIDNLYAGTKTAYTGIAQSPLGAQILQGMGFSPEVANLLYGTTQLGATGFTAPLVETAAAGTINTVAKEANATSSAASVDATAESTSTVFRVQGGVMPNASKTLITLDTGGNPIIENGTLNISMGDSSHAQYFQSLRPGSTITSFEIPSWLDDFIQKNAIPQDFYRSNPLNQGGLAPKIVDITTPGNSYELPPPWAHWLQENAIPGSGKVQ